MDKETTAAIRKIIDYIENAERKNFEDAEPEDRAGHICNSVQLVRKWLDIKQWLESPSLTTIDPAMATALMKELKDATVDCEE